MLSFANMRFYFARLLVALCVFTIIFEIYVFLIVSRDRRMYFKTPTFGLYEEMFCGINFRKEELKKEDKQRFCPALGIITSLKHSGFCQNVWDYANVIAGALATGLVPYVPICLSTSLESSFDNLTLPNFTTISHCPFKAPSQSARSIAEWMEEKNRRKSVIITGDDLYNSYVVSHLTEIQKHFVFRKALKEIATSTLLRAQKMINCTQPTYVCMHIKNTNMIVKQEYDGLFPSIQFFLDAITYFRDKYNNTAFIAIADNDVFWRTRFSPNDTLVLKENAFLEIGSTLSILCHCNHSILGFGGCAPWGALFSGGETIMSISINEDYAHLIRALPQWSYLLHNKESETLTAKEYDKYVF